MNRMQAHQTIRPLEQLERRQAHGREEEEEEEHPNKDEEHQRQRMRDRIPASFQDKLRLQSVSVEGIKI